MGGSGLLRPLTLLLLLPACVAGLDPMPLPSAAAAPKPEPSATSAASPQTPAAEPTRPSVTDVWGRPRPETASQNPAAKTSGVRKADARDPGVPQPVGSQPDAQNPAVSRPDASKSGAQDPVAQSPKAATTGAQGPGAQDPVAQSPKAATTATQDPVRKGRPAPGPEGLNVLPPVEEPFTAPLTRSDLPGRYTPPDPVEGVWRLRTRVIAGQPAMEAKGFLFIGRRHLMVQFVAPGSDPDIPLLRSGSYTWKRTDELDTVRLMNVFGYYNDGSGDIHIEAEGAMTVRRLQLIDGGLRMQQDAGNWLDFVRVE